jgi:hypothetical protein
MKTKLSIFWFRRDLRLEDNAGLCRALAAERFAAWRRAGFLALKFKRSTNVEPCTNVSTKHETPPFAKPLLAVVVLFSSVISIVSRF